jgi:ribosomal protein S7
MKIKSKTNIKQKLTNHIFLNGKKNTSEKILLKVFKGLQKISTKNSIKLVQFAILYSLPIFRINKFSQKKKRRKKIKEIPSFIQSEETRISRAIKFILFSSRKKRSDYFYIHLKQEILLNLQSKSSIVENKNDFQKSAIGKKNLLKYFQKK